MTVEELIDKFQLALGFLNYTGDKAMPVAMDRETIEQVIAILEDYQKMKGEQK